VAWPLVVVAGMFETDFAVPLKQSHGISRVGLILARPGFIRRVLAFTIPAGTAAATAGLAAYAIARTTPGVGITAARTAAMLAVFVVGLWVLVLAAGRSVARGAPLVAVMGGAPPSVLHARGLTTSP
jgi:hypothetical protein